MEKRRATDPEHTSFEELRSKDQHTLLYKIWVILSGNGNPEEGLMWKVQKLMEFRTSVESAINKIVVSAIISGASVFGIFLFTVFKDMILRGKL